jgi:Flp pilus assembly protein TadD
MKKEKKENRCFRRYTKKYAARIFKGKEIHPVDILDYSLDGIGVFTKNPLHVNQGDILMIENNELSLRADFKVEWLSITGSGLRIGLHKLEPLKGSLKNYRLSDIFIGIQRSLKTGILKIKSGSIRKRIYIRSGDMIFADSNQDEDRLGEFLLREGKISQESFDRSSELIIKTGKRQGAILVELGVITPKELFWAVKRQAEEIILSIFDFSDADFEFQEGSLPTEEVITLKMSAGNLIYNGTKRLTCIEQARDFLNLQPETVLGFSEDPLNLFQDISFDEEDKRFISFIDGRRTLQDVISLAGLDDSTGRRTLAALLSTSVVEASEGEAPQKGITPEDVLQQPEMPPGLIERIEEMCSKCQTVDYYALLDVDGSVTDAKLRWAFYRLAKEFHPDRHFYLDKDMKVKLHQIFSCLTNAYSVLSSTEKRREYDKPLSVEQTSVSRAELARSKFDEGYTAYEKELFADAVRIFSEAAQLDDSVARYQYYYGLALIRLDRLKEAELIMTKAQRLEPENDEILTALGYLYVSLGFPLRAQWNFRKALELNPTNERAKNGLLASNQEP